jgi:hypothetical protein
MKSLLFITLAATLAAAGAQAQTRIWRCGNTYTNDAVEAKTKSCKVVDGGNVTIVEGTRVNNPAAGAPAASAAPPSGGNGVKVASAPPSSQRVVSSEQRARDADARAILESELKKAEARHTELVKEYNNGEPDKQGIEHRNHQKYLDRVAELKASIARNESDIAGIKRELARLPQ